MSRFLGDLRLIGGHGDDLPVGVVVGFSAEEHEPLIEKEDGQKRGDGNADVTKERFVILEEEDPPFEKSRHFVFLDLLSVHALSFHLNSTSLERFEKDHTTGRKPSSRFRLRIGGWCGWRDSNPRP